MKKFKSLVFAFSLFFSVLANSEEINLKKAASREIGRASCRERV